MGLFGGGGDEGSNGMMRTVVTMCVFVAVFSVLLGYAAPLINGGAASVSGPQSFDVATIAQVNFAETDNGLYMYEIKPSDYGTFLNTPPDDLITTDSIEANTAWFDGNRSLRYNLDGFYVWCLPVKDYDSQGDAIAFYAKTGWWDAHTIIFRESDIINHFNSQTHRAALYGSLGASLNFYFQFKEDYTPADALNYRFNYNVSVGQSYLNETQDKNNALNVIFGLLTFNLPGGGTGFPLMDMILSTAFVASCGFILYWAITRII